MRSNLAQMLAAPPPELSSVVPTAVLSLPVPGDCDAGLGADEHVIACMMTYSQAVRQDGGGVQAGGRFV